MPDSLRPIHVHFSSNTSSQLPTQNASTGINSYESTELINSSTVVGPSNRQKKYKLTTGNSTLDSYISKGIKTVDNRARSGASWAWKNPGKTLVGLLALTGTHVATGIGGRVDGIKAGFNSGFTSGFSSGSAEQSKECRYAIAETVWDYLKPIEPTVKAAIVPYESYDVSPVLAMETSDPNTLRVIQGKSELGSIHRSNQSATDVSGQVVGKMKDGALVARNGALVSKTGSISFPGSNQPWSNLWACNAFDSGRIDKRFYLDNRDNIIEAQLTASLAPPDAWYALPPRKKASKRKRGSSITKSADSQDFKLDKDSLTPQEPLNGSEFQLSPKKQGLMLEKHQVKKFV